MTDLPRPVEHLREMMRRYPDLGREVDRFRAGRGTALPDWPDWCFLPMAAWMAIATGGSPSPIPTPRDVYTMQLLAAVGTWRYTQGIYRIDPDLRAALTESDVSGDLPSEVLHRLPEWSVYVDTPGMAWGNADLYGFWAHLEADANTGDTELRILLDQDAALTAVPVHLGPWPLVEAVERTIRESRQQAAKIGLRMPDTGNASVILADQLVPLISILLYLCSDEPEIDNERQPGTSPRFPVPKRTKRGVRLFAPDRPTVWIVGHRIGDVIRESRTLAQAGDRRVRAHIRRGHWHGYWRGPRDGERRFLYHWLPPMVVGGGDDS